MPPFRIGKYDKLWRVEAGYTHTYDLLKQHGGKMAITILVKMMPTDGRYPLQKYLRDNLSKLAGYDESEEELFAELHRREADGDEGGDAKGLNQIGEEGDKNADDKATEEEWTEKTVWSEEWGWI